MVKIGGSKNRNLSKKGKLNENKWEFMNFVVIWEYATCIVNLGRMDAHG